MSHYLFKRLTVLFFSIWLVTLPGNLSAQDKKPDDFNKPNNSTEVQEEKPNEFEQLLEKELNKDTNSNKEEVKDSPNWFFQIFKTIIGLGLIIMLLYLFRKYMMFKNSFGNIQSGIINLLHEYPVATGKKLQIIEVGNRLLLIGVSDAGIQLVSEFKEKLPIDQIKLAVESLGKKESKDFWVELSKGITNKIQNLIGKKNTFNKYQKEDPKSWEKVQLNARLKIQEMRDKKKIFEEMDNPDDNQTL